KQRADQATREATAPCCVAISATIAPAATIVATAPAASATVLAVPTHSTGAVDFARAASVEAALPPPPRGATPGAARAALRNCSHAEPRSRLRPPAGRLPGSESPFAVTHSRRGAVRRELGSHDEDRNAVRGRRAGTRRNAGFGEDAGGERRERRERRA